jgi:tRNA nucleotidyltransferase (CCA-adding enzyme)
VVLAARALARRRGERLYLAGGVVRDLVLQRPIRDVDLVVEGEAAAFSRELAELVGGSCRLHDRFGTATVELTPGIRLDVAGTRRESYARPGALPDVVAGAAIEEDLARRDFTVNAVALELVPRRRLVDPFGGCEDLARGWIRFLHARSPQDDPTRALRAVRYANRLGFRLEPSARRAIAAAIRSGAFDAVSGDRLRRELALLLSEENRGRAVRMLSSLGLHRAISSALAQPGAASRVAAAEALGRLRGSSPGWLCYLLAWMGEAKTGDLRALTDRLGFAGSERRRLLAWPSVRRKLAAGFVARPASERARRARGLGDDEMLAAAARLPSRDRSAVLAAAAPLTLSIGGRDLVSSGVPPGPWIGAALARTRAAREDGRIGADEELAYALRAARSSRERR